MAVQTFNTSLEAMAQKRLDEMIADKQVIAGNGSAKDHADYKWQCGIIQGLQMAKEAITAAHSDLQKR